MVELTVEDFSRFFEALWGYPPFAWQHDLASRVLGNTNKPWPEAIALPTAAGKTACMDIAVFALASQAGRLRTSEPITAPRRVFFVVDRRVIVDEAFERGRRLAGKLAAAKNGILLEVAKRLKDLACGPKPLASWQLRGGMYRSDAWARSPLQPAIIASTVDQVGSRLLFRADGRSSRAWPIQAGLTGNDCLILLDEAHCSQPFLETLQSVARYRTWAERPLASPFDAVVMSATPPAGLDDVLHDRSSQTRDPGHPLGRRQLAAKPTHLKVVKGATGRRAPEQLAAAMVREAEALAEGNRAVVVFANRVATARHAHRLFAGRYGEDAILLTGRMRPLDKDDTVSHRLAPLSASRSASRNMDRPVFVVATQTLEVGADLDFDALVTECASLDALRQRFGRLNRMGRDIGTRAVVMVRGDQEETSEDDSVYGSALAATWKWLNERQQARGELDLGIAALAADPPTEEDLERLNTPADHAPVMLPAHLDCLVQTSPEPLPSPDVSLFLHGPERASADVQVCWRADLDLSDEAATTLSIETLALCPPAAAECVAVPLWVLRRWLRGDPDTAAETDVEGADAVDENRVPQAAEAGLARPLLRWRSRAEVERVASSAAIRPGDVVVIPAAYGGWETLGDLARGPDGQPVLDWGDRAFRQTRARALLRLHPEVIAQWPDFDGKEQLRAMAVEGRERLQEDPHELVDELRTLLRYVGEAPGVPGWLQDIAGSLGRDPGLRRCVTPHPRAGLVIRGSQRLQDPELIADVFTDEDDATASGTTDVALDDHLEGVSGFAGRFAESCGLDEGLTDTLRRAGRSHDLGKADPRFQALLRGGNPWARGAKLAKSRDLPQGSSAFERAREASGYPEGGRHELLSIRLLESDPAVLQQDPLLADLVLHLVASHHGHCRPFAPVVTDDEEGTVQVHLNGSLLEACPATGLERIDSGVAERFWSLTRCFGWWGLAWLEAMARLADHRRSEKEEGQAGRRQ